ncbi:putative zinc finger protein [Humibacillus xanthopallidus]|uniref:Regulator of SigK n=1 Tax=Humibacillus xanthopallidus TaxID=412689 RepID=A0A543PKI4_9MICO|nr:anti-sigma factor [Humibacillus xanthopallidus]TQN44590.1 putative zinc finger protein [Humibacillus xanthopallidus]
MSDDIHALSGAYAVDALDDSERAQFERHLAGCSACQAEVASLVAAATALSSLSDMTPPPALRAKVLQGITTVRPLPPIVAGNAQPVDVAHSAPAPAPAAAPEPEPAAPLPLETTAPAVGSTPAAPETAPDELAARRGGRHAETRRSGPLRWLVAAATAAILAIGGFAVWRSTDGGSTTAPTVAEQVRSAPDAKTSSNVALPGGGTATVVRSPSLGKAVVITSDLPSAPAGKVYQLWLQDKSGHFTSAGLMAAAGDQTVVLQGDAADAQAAGITVEPAGGSEQPTSNPIAFFSFA